MMVLLIGMIGSGKGEVTDLLVKKGYLSVNDDSQLLSLHNGRYDLYDPKHKGIYKQMETTAITSCLLTNTPLVIDRPSFRASTRMRYIALAKTFETTVVGIEFPREDALTHATRRFESDPRGLKFEHWLECAQRHEAEWQQPLLSEGFDNLVPAEVARRMIQDGQL